VSNALTAVAMPVLPAIGGDALLFGTALVVLVSISLAGRTLLLWQAIERRRRSIAEQTARVEQWTDGAGIDGAGRLRASRLALAEANAQLEGSLWALPAFDRRATTAGLQLAAIRRRVDDWRGENGDGVKQSMSAATGTLELLSAARRLRRVIQR
jgi:hypothetical protein